MSWPCLVCKCKHALCLINFASLSFPSFFDWSCWFVAHSWKRSLSRRPMNEDDAYMSLAPRIAFWGPDLGPILGPVLGDDARHSGLLGCSAWRSMFCAKDMIDVPCKLHHRLSGLHARHWTHTRNLLPPLSGSCTLVLCACKVQCLQVVQLSWQLATVSLCISACCSVPHPGSLNSPRFLSFLLIHLVYSFFGGDQWGACDFFLIAGTQTRTCRHHLHSLVFYLAILFNGAQQTNNFNQRREGNLGWRNWLDKEHVYICRPNMVKTCFPCRRY